jgi:hypothetical protein
MRFVRAWAAAAMIILVLTGCNGTANQTPTPLPDAKTLLNRAATEIQNAKSVQVKLQLTGAPAYVDVTNTIAFISANGVYVAPDLLNATVAASLLGVPGSVDVIAIGDTQYMKNKLLTGDKWLQCEFSPGFNAQKLISSDSGIQAGIQSLKDVKLVGIENVDGVNMFHISGSAADADISSLTVGLIRGSTVQADIFIVVDTGRVDRVIMVQPDTVTDKQPKPSTWTLELYNYNGGGQVTAPQNAPVCARDKTPTPQPTIDVLQIPAQPTAVIPPTSEATQAQ